MYEKLFLSMKVAVCAIAKLENNYIIEWLNYYKNIGFDKVFLYDNNDINTETLNEICGSYDSNFLEIKNVIGQQVPQNRSYLECYKVESKNFDYIAFFDIDEFLYLPNNLTIQQFLSQNKFKDFECIRIPWKLYNDNNLITVENNNFSVLNRFKNGKLVKDCKSIVKTGLNIDYITPHGPLYLKTCDPNGNVCNNGSYNNIQQCLISDKIIETDTYIKHYMMKTLEEFIKYKMKREKHNSFGKESRIGIQGIDRFFRYNEKTPEKLNYLKSIGINYE